MINAELNFSSKLPHSTEAEQSIIGSTLADPSVLPKVIELVKPDYFYNEIHKQIFSIIYRMFSNNISVDVVTVLTEAEKLHIFDNSTEGKKYLAEITNLLPTVLNIESYCKIVTDKYLIRSLGIVARDILHKIHSGEHDSQFLLDFAEQKIYNIRQNENIKEISSLADAVYEAYDHLGKISGEEREMYLGTRTGFNSLDEIISGLNNSDLIIIASRPAMGKTSFALNIAINVARQNYKDVVVFNLEMSKVQLAIRLLSTESLVESTNLRNGRIKTNEWGRLATSAAYLGTIPFYIDDTGNITVQQMKAKLRCFKKLGLVVIDYLQLINSTNKSDNRVTIISEITRQIKLMAKELNVPVILLSQLSRSVESRIDKRPMMSDLRESGSIEQDADIIIFLYRDAYYNKESTHNHNISECIIAKNRHGETGTVKIIWDGRFTRFSNLDLSTLPDQ